MERRAFGWTLVMVLICVPAAFAAKKHKLTKIKVEYSISNSTEVTTEAHFEDGKGEHKTILVQPGSTKKGKQKIFFDASDTNGPNFWVYVSAFDAEGNEEFRVSPNTQYGKLFDPDNNRLDIAVYRYIRPDGSIGDIIIKITVNPKEL